MLSLLLAILIDQHPVKFEAVGTKFSGRYKASVVYPVFTSHTDLAIFATTETKKAVLEPYIEFIEYTDYYWSNPVYLDALLEYESRTTVSILSEKLISVLISSFYFKGGNHPNSNYRPINFVILDGSPRRLQLQDVLAKGISPEQVIDQIIVPRINEMKKLRGFRPWTDAQYLPPDMFVVTPSGFSWTFAPYLAGAFAIGEYIVKVKWNEFSNMLDLEAVEQLLGLKPA